MEIPKINERVYEGPGHPVTAPRYYYSSDIKFKRYNHDGSKTFVFKSGTEMHFKPNSTAQVEETYDPRLEQLLYKIKGDGVSVNVCRADMTKVDEYLEKWRSPDDKINPTPKKIEFIIDGNRNKVVCDKKTNVEIKGDNNIIITGDTDDNVTINGTSNIINVNGGDDNVLVQKGGGNTVYLGKGNDDFEAPDDSVANFIHRDTDGWDSVKNATDLNPYFGSFLGNLGFVGDVWGAIKVGAKGVSDYAKEIPSKIKEAVEISKDGLYVLGENAKKLDPMEAKLKFEKEANERYIRALDNYVDRMNDNKCP